MDRLRQPGASVPALLAGLDDETASAILGQVRSDLAERKMLERLVKLRVTDADEILRVEFLAAIKTGADAGGARNELVHDGFEVVLPFNLDEVAAEVAFRSRKRKDEQFGAEPLADRLGGFALRVREAELALGFCRLVYSARLAGEDPPTPEAFVDELTSLAFPDR